MAQMAGQTQSWNAGMGGMEYFTLKDYQRLFWRRRWFMVVTALGLALATAIVGYFVPNKYRAQTVILVDPQKVPDRFVASTVTATVADRLSTLRQQILSTTRLSQIADEMNLYADERKSKTHEEIIEIMRKAIEVDIANANPTRPDSTLGAFAIAYSNEDRHLAAKVTNRLASLFIEENIKAREQQVLGTADFLDRELEEARSKLNEKEEQIKQLKQKYVSELPQSQSVHVSALSSLQLDMRSEMEAINRAEQQKLYLQALISESVPVVNLDRNVPPEVIALRNQLVQSQLQMDALLKRYGQQHPDVRKKMLEVRDLQEKIAEAQKEAEQNAPPDPRAVGASSSQTASGSQARRNPVVESQLVTLDDEIQKRGKRIEEIRQRIAFHQSKLERIPVLEAEMAAIMRDYDAARTLFLNLNDRKFSADMFTKVETLQKGERFLVLDQAAVPERHASPNRPLINAIGLAAGLLVAVFLVLALEYVSPTVKTEQEITEQFGVPVMGEIPWVTTAAQRSAARRKLLFAGAGSTLLFAAYAAMFVLTWK
jgi:polysaccharide chain length determinant protein (PEP-CTERM system associated)